MKKVYVKRQPNGYDGQLIALDKLHNGYIGHTTGGYHTTYSRDIYFAYVNPDDAPGVACSHRHDYTRSGIKVCVFPTGSEKGAFEAFCKQYNLPLPERQHRLPSLDNEIRIVLQMTPNHSIRRSELRYMMIYDKGYSPLTFRRILWNMKQDPTIEMIGGPTSPNQIIHLL